MKPQSQLQPTLAATVASEDLACGDFVALHSEAVEVPSFLWAACDSSLSPHEMVRLRMIPERAGQPLRVFAICLPFVYAKSPQGQIITVDTRQSQLVRLNRRCAKRVWKESRSSAK